MPSYISPEYTQRQEVNYQPNQDGLYNIRKICYNTQKAKKVTRSDLHVF
jgi:hypothetical protein